jgi:hypothetical protein
MLRNIPTLVGSMFFGIVIAAAALTLVGSNARALQRDAGADLFPTNGLIASALENLSREARPTPAQIRSAIQTVRGQMDRIELRSKEDYVNASKILSRGSTTEDALLAHELAICALALGDERARLLAAQSWDQFLVRKGMGQRFGTQEKSKGPSIPYSTVTDSMRVILDVNSPRKNGQKHLRAMPSVARPALPIEALN